MSAKTPSRSVDSTDVVADLLNNGLPGASLACLARAAGTSARMLVHHFGTRDTLLATALTRARQQELARARQVLPPSEDFLDTVARSWQWFGSDDAGQYFRLFGQVAASERLGGEPAQPGRPALTTEWIDLAAEGFRAAGRSHDAAHQLATILIAQIRGLLLDLDATGDHARIENAFRAFVGTLSVAGTQRPSEKSIRGRR